jgi:hypothetical protein
MATLSTYITEVRRLLHDANGNFYTEQQLTDYINGSRERVVRDTGCLRTIQIVQTPCKVPASAALNGVNPTNPTAWQANTAYALNAFIFSNIFIYQVTTAGTSGASAPPYPQSQQNNITNYPPSTEFFNGTVGLTYVGNCENIYYSAMPQGNKTLDIININLYWGNTRVPLDYLAWSDFNVRLRFWQNYIGRPLAYSNYGQDNIYIGPIPDEAYQLEIDTVILPEALTLANAGANDPIKDPYTTSVKFYAAYLAKYYEQSYGEAEIYKQEYNKQTSAVLTSVFTRRIPTPYSSPY